MDDDAKQPACASEKGFSAAFKTRRWLIDCFDPSTKARALRAVRLLFLDGLKIHTSVDFLEAFWERNIVCIILPANLSSISQALDVDFFNHLRLAYDRQIDNYQLGSTAGSVHKAFFYR
jgi:hypothetical protein